MKKRQTKTAFILGAGLGIRLRPLTDICPKPLLEIDGRPIITYAMEHLSGVGIKRFIVNTHHLPDMYKKAFPDGNFNGIPVIFRYEPVLLDTGGGLKNIEDLLSDDEVIICYNGDVLTDLPLKKLIDFHEEKRPLATLALRTKGHNLNVEIDSESNVVDIRGILSKKGVMSCQFTGIYTVDTSILKYIEPNKVESIITVFLKIIEEYPRAIKGVIIDEGIWYDIGTLQMFYWLKDNFRGFDGK